MKHFEVLMFKADYNNLCSIYNFKKAFFTVYFLLLLRWAGNWQNGLNWLSNRFELFVRKLCEVVSHSFNSIRKLKNLEELKSVGWSGHGHFWNFDKGVCMSLLWGDLAHLSCCVNVATMEDRTWIMLKRPECM